MANLLSGEPIAAAASTTTGSWTPAGQLATAVRWYYEDSGPVLLADGRVLVVGGSDGNENTPGLTALYNPATNAWAAGPPQLTARKHATVTRLPDGRVLVAGGVNGPVQYATPGLATTELYDPSTGRWTAGPPMSQARFFHNAVLLADGRVLVAGGLSRTTVNTAAGLSSAELFDPATNTWAATGAMTDRRSLATLTRLADGRILVVGGTFDTGYGYATQLAFSELYDPRAGTWSPTGSSAVTRATHQTVALPDGGALAFGGWYDGPVGARQTLYSQRLVERFDPVTGDWAQEALLPVGRATFRAVTLTSGKILLIGGCDTPLIDGGYQNATVYDPPTRSFTSTPGLVVGRWGPGAVGLADGRVLAVGGTVRADESLVDYADELTPTAEVFTP
jgi:hypothetical protein